MLGQEESCRDYTGWLWNRFLPSLLTSAVYSFSQTFEGNKFYFWHWFAVVPGLFAGQVEKWYLFELLTCFFSLMSWMDNLVLLCCRVRFFLGGWEWPNMLAALLYIVFCRRSRCSVRELQFISFLDTISSSCAQRWWFALPKAIGVFMLKPSRSLFSLVKCELVVWVFSWLVFSILGFTASREEEISSRTTLQSFTRAAEDTVDLDDVEINLLRSPQSFEDMLLICGFRIIRLWLIYLISHSFIGMYHGMRTGSNSIIIKTMWVVRNIIRVRVF